MNESKGFGIHLVELLTDQLQGDLKVESNTNGTNFVLEFEI